MVRKNNQKNYKKLPIIGKRPIDEKEENHLNEILKYEFYNLEDPGVFIKFSYGSTLYKENFTFLHGEKYEVPRHVARHVENRSTPIHEWRANGIGKMVGKKVGDKPRFQMREIYS